MAEKSHVAEWLAFCQLFQTDFVSRALQMQKRGVHPETNQMCPNVVEQTFIELQVDRYICKYILRNT